MDFRHRHHDVGADAVHSLIHCRHFWEALLGLLWAATLAADAVLWRSFYGGIMWR